MAPLAHIAGIPVEETIGMFAPAGTVAVGAVGVILRARWRRLRERGDRTKSGART